MPGGAIKDNVTPNQTFEVILVTLSADPQIYGTDRPRSRQVTAIIYRLSLVLLTS